MVLRPARMCVCVCNEFCHGQRMSDRARARANWYIYIYFFFHSAIAARCLIARQLFDRVRQCVILCSCFLVAEKVSHVLCQLLLFRLIGMCIECSQVASYRFDTECWIKYCSVDAASIGWVRLYQMCTVCSKHYGPSMPNADVRVCANTWKFCECFVALISSWRGLATRGTTTAAAMHFFFL